jgi:hypothetical protein
MESSLIALVPAADGLIGEWRSQHDPSAGLGVSAHITVAAPFLEASLITPVVLEQLGVIAAAHDELRVSFDRVAHLPGAVALLPADSRGLDRLTAALLRTWPDLEPALRTGRTRPYHLTIACTDDLQLFKEIAGALRPTLPLRCHLGRSACDRP